MPPRTRPSWVDVLLACGVTGLGAVELATGQITGPFWATGASVLLFGAPLLWRRSHPWTALLVVFGTIFGLYLAGVDQYDYLASVVSALTVLFTFAGLVELGQAVVDGARAGVDQVLQPTFQVGRAIRMLRGLAHGLLLRGVR